MELERNGTHERAPATMISRIQTGRAVLKPPAERQEDIWVARVVARECNGRTEGENMLLLSESDDHVYTTMAVFWSVVFVAWARHRLEFPFSF